MRLDMQCSSCFHSFQAPTDTRTAEALVRMSAEGPWSSLGDGATIEDRIFAVLTAHGNIHCPECREAVSIGEESVAQLAKEMLANW